MSKKACIDKIDEFARTLVDMGREGYLNDPEANTAAGATQYELSRLREILVGKEVEPDL